MKLKLPGVSWTASSTPGKTRRPAPYIPILLEPGAQRRPTKSSRAIGASGITLKERWYNIPKHRRLNSTLSIVPLLPGITQHKIRTDRLKMAYLAAGTGKTPIVLVHGNVSSSHFFQDFMLALAATGRYTGYATDMRGHGDSEVLPVDATRGVRDFSDDLASFVQALGLTSFHLLGWSLGGNLVMQYAIDYPGFLRSLTLQAPGSPFGFGGTKDAKCTPNWPDLAARERATDNPPLVR